VHVSARSRDGVVALTILKDLAIAKLPEIYNKSKSGLSLTTVLATRPAVGLKSDLHI